MIRMSRSPAVGWLLDRDGASLASLDRDSGALLDPDPSKPAFSRETLHSKTMGGGGEGGA